MGERRINAAPGRSDKPPANYTTGHAASGLTEQKQHP